MPQPWFCGAIKKKWTLIYLYREGHWEVHRNIHEGQRTGLGKMAIQKVAFHSELQEMHLAAFSMVWWGHVWTHIPETAASQPTPQSLLILSFERGHPRELARLPRNRNAAAPPERHFSATVSWASRAIEAKFRRSLPTEKSWMSWLQGSLGKWAFDMFSFELKNLFLTKIYTVGKFLPNIRRQFRYQTQTGRQKEKWYLFCIGIEVLGSSQNPNHFYLYIYKYLSEMGLPEKLTLKQISIQGFH